MESRIGFNGKVLDEEDIGDKIESIKRTICVFVEDYRLNYFYI